MLYFVIINSVNFNLFYVFACLQNDQREPDDAHFLRFLRLLVAFPVRDTISQAALLDVSLQCMINAISFGSPVIEMSTRKVPARTTLVEMDASREKGRSLLTSVLTLEARNHGKAWLFHPGPFLRMSKVSVLRLAVSISRSVGGDTALEIKRHRKTSTSWLMNAVLMTG